jgi:fructose-1-phosphate kinase PfkB-like protein
VKPNDVEAQKLTGLPAGSVPELVTAAAAIRDMGAANVAVSLGKKGALLASEGQAWLMSSPVIEERNPIGAGDSLVGGLVWGLDEGFSLPDALRWGIACGAATASQSGTAVGTRSQVEELVDQVRVRPVDSVARTQP